MSAHPLAVYLARHGETEWNRVGRWQGRTDIPLSDVGRAQARALADHLRGRGIAEIHASDLSRAHETAHIVATVLGITRLTSDPRLRERGFGIFEGLTREECAERHPDVWQRYLADRRSTPPDAEPQADVVARIVGAMTAIAEAAHPAGPILVVSHGGAIRSFVHHITGTTPPPLNNAALFRVTFEAGRFVSVVPD